MSITTLHGDCREVLQTLYEKSVQMICTSPPYYGLRRYSDDPREIGQEATPDCLAWARREPPCGACYVCAMRDVFAQLWRVLRDDGVVFLNLGDSYSSGGMSNPSSKSTLGGGKDRGAADYSIVRKAPTGLADKQLLGIPWRVALALQADGWYLRSDIVWAKPNCMPESVTDRPTRAHEYVFLLAKSARYFYDAAAIAEQSVGEPPVSRMKLHAGLKAAKLQSLESSTLGTPANQTRNRRTVWHISTQNYSGAHYATMPEALIEPCILAGSSAQACEHCGAAWVRVVKRESNWQERKAAGGTAGNVGASDTYQNGVHGKNMSHDLGPKSVRDLGFAPSCACPDNTGSAASVVLDPFGGSGTVGRVALRLQRRAVLIELNQEYIAEHIEKRTDGLQVEMFV